MAEHDAISQVLKRDPNAVVVMQLDEWNHVAEIYVWLGEFRRGPGLAEETLKKLVADGVLLPAPHLTPERTYVHAQPDARWASMRAELG